MTTRAISLHPPVRELFRSTVSPISHLPITAVLVWDVVRRKGLFTHEGVFFGGVVREIGLFTHKETKGP